MANSTKLILFISALIALLALFVFILKPNSNHEQNNETSNKPMEVTSTNTNATDSAQAVQASTQSVNESIANKWQWQEGTERTTIDAQIIRDYEQNGTLFTADSVYAALEAVEVDENGDLVLDSKALFALDEALERIHNQLDSQSLLELQNLIKEALPGKLGEQVAQLVGDYNRFLGAQAEFNQIHQYSATDSPTLASVENDRNLYGDLQSLRAAHLGTDTAERLFQQNDAGARFMFDMMALDLNTSLTPAEREQRRREIQETFDKETKDP